MPDPDKDPIGGTDPRKGKLSAPVAKPKKPKVKKPKKK